MNLQETLSAGFAELKAHLTALFTSSKPAAATPPAESAEVAQLKADLAKAQAKLEKRETKSRPSPLSPPTSTEADKRRAKISKHEARIANLAQAITVAKSGTPGAATTAAIASAEEEIAIRRGKIESHRAKIDELNATAISREMEQRIERQKSKLADAQARLQSLDPADAGAAAASEELRAEIVEREAKIAKLEKKAAAKATSAAESETLRAENARLKSEAGAEGAKLSALLAGQGIPASRLPKTGSGASAMTREEAIAKINSWPINDPRGRAEFYQNHHELIFGK